MWIIGLAAIWMTISTVKATASSKQHQQTYNYFAFGSNMALSTMTALRNLNPIAQTPAVLPNHRLCFNVPGIPLVEPSWASVEPDQENNVHGVLYKLTSDDFARVCRSEGVPFSYQLHRCKVIPYVSNKEGSAGTMALEKYHSNDSSVFNVSAFTLRAGREEWRKRIDIPPSQSYINVLLRGAREFHLDKEYVKKLENVPVAKNALGIAESMLKAAEQSKMK
jgi:hypothetical protein